ncbi:MAG: TfoX/Sxy family protein [Gordonibacter sp.]|nr:TfoX/Sxy family protein [Gordonibacter sp.]
MASTNEYLEYVLDLLGSVDGIRHRKMMGEYVLYCRDKVFGGIYDDRFLIKTTDSVKELLFDAPQQLNYKGGTLMTLVTSEDQTLIAHVVTTMWAELPMPKKRR